jgi:hypothetical protein
LQAPGAMAGASDTIEGRRRRFPTTDTQLYLAIGIAIVAVLTSLTISLLQVFAIRADVARIHGDMNGMRGDFREDMRAMRADLNILTGKVVEIVNRLTRIEERLEHR